MNTCKTIEKVICAKLTKAMSKLIYLRILAPKLIRNLFIKYIDLQIKVPNYLYKIAANYSPKPSW